jgi:hypothetical protein
MMVELNEAKKDGNKRNHDRYLFHLVRVSSAKDWTQGAASNLHRGMARRSLLNGDIA